MRVRHRNREAGFTMIPVVLGMTLVIALTAVAVTAVSGDIHLNRYDLDQKRAYEAAKAGVNDYLFHLHEESDYWAHCTDVKPENNAVNQQGSTAKRRQVPGNTGAEYAIELLPAAGQTQYTQCSTADPSASMLESSGLMKGTFRIRSTGFSGDAESALVATFKPATFLDYVYFTQLETSDPVTYGYADTSEAYKGVNTQCAKTIEEGRYSQRIPGTQSTYCDVISFVSEDVINGPMHTNDAFAICGSPTLGRNASDPLEVSGPPKGWFSTSELTRNSSCVGSESNFKGTLTADSPTITPPETNSELRTIAGLRFSGQVRICLNGETLSVGAGSSCTTSPLYSGPIPSSGVVYVESSSCGTTYSPFTATYLATSTCGNAYVHGNYSGQLTIAAENDVIIDGNLVHSGEGVLGLIANNFVRIYHPFSSDETSTQTAHNVCNGGRNGTGSVQDIQIDAAILAINHSFIVDHYDCGAGLGDLTVNGAIAQNYRGAVGTSSGTGYIKDYNYDDRLRFMQPPSFTKPRESDWVVGRLTIE